MKDGKLREIAASLGAEVPYFLEGGTVLGLDRGDVLYPLVDPPAAWVTLVVPAFGVSTADAFRWWDQEGSAVEGRRTLSAPAFENDLQGPVAAHHPEIAESSAR